MTPAARPRRAALRLEAPRAMKDRPILFSAPMVRAMLDGSKSQTRRLVKPQPDPWDDGKPVLMDNEEPVYWAIGGYHLLPRFFAGQTLWVRETFCQGVYEDGGEMIEGRIHYRATEPEPDRRWKQSIFMRRSESRLTLEVTEVRVQRLQEISEEDACAEGIRSKHVMDDPYPHYFLEGQEAKWEHAAVPIYANLWDQINGKRAPWASNPWVWAITFRRIAP